MISCNFFGGLGNNLFQLATAYGVSKKFNYKLVLPNYVDRGNISIYGQSTTLEIDDLLENRFYFDDNVSSNIPVYIHSDYHLGSTDYSFKEIPIKDDIKYHGYFQSEKYFSDIDISNEFILKKENISEIKKKYTNLFNKKNISIHYRLGGDRVTNHMQHFHKNVSVDYYKKALETINDYDDDKYNILVFTDKIELCKTLLENLNYNFQYINTPNNILDFTFMSICDVNIVGNSTFSWWAAYLNKTINKKTIVTETEWFGPGYKHFKLKDTFPKDWVRL